MKPVAFGSVQFYKEIRSSSHGQVSALQVSDDKNGKDKTHFQSLISDVSQYPSEWFLQEEDDLVILTRAHPVSL